MKLTCSVLETEPIDVADIVKYLRVDIPRENVWNISY